MYARLRYSRDGGRVLRKILIRVFGVTLSICRFFKGRKVKNEGEKKI